MRGFFKGNVWAAPRDTHSTPSRDVLIALARLDGVEGHPNGLQ
jgi:hypothetical protein